jgi:two-component system phosphate regulon response regulator PhoB
MTAELHSREFFVPNGRSVVATLIHQVVPLPNSGLSEITRLWHALLSGRAIINIFMKRILVIDDEPDVADLLAITLRKQGGFSVSSACDATTGLRKAREESPLLILLDLMLPAMSGFEVCRLLKRDSATAKIPVIILTARVDEVDRILGFELGAADYVTKPFSPHEVALRIRAIAGRYEEGIGEQEFAAHKVCINWTRHEVSVGGRLVRLTAVEFRLLTYLIQTRGRTQSRDRLLAQVWNYSHLMTTRTVDTHMLRLRRKLGAASDLVETIRGYGYRFRQMEDARDGLPIQPPESRMNHAPSLEYGGNRIGRAN